jgi:polyferredoxin
VAPKRSQHTLAFAPLVVRLKTGVAGSRVWSWACACVLPGSWAHATVAGKWLIKKQSKKQKKKKKKEKKLAIHPSQNHFG